MATSGTQTERATWTIDDAHTDVGFSVRHMMISTVKGSFPGVEGSIRLDEDDPTNSSISVRIDAATITTRNEQRDAHLRSADFFDVESHPEITFESRSIEARGDGEYRIEGDLTIRGTTRPIVLEAEQVGQTIDPWGKQRIAFTATGSIDRSDFGLEWNQALETGGVLVSDKVKLIIEGQAVRD